MGVLQTATCSTSRHEPRVGSFSIFNFNQTEKYCSYSETFCIDPGRYAAVNIRVLQMTPPSPNLTQQFLRLIKSSAKKPS